MADQPTFLYVEDDHLSREIMEAMLNNLGYTQVVMFENSKNFLNRVEAISPEPDIIFLDIHLQPHDGFAMLSMLRQHPTFTEKVIIAVTASVMNDEITRLKQVGFNGAIGKPLDFENFSDLMIRLLDGQEIWYIV